MSRHISALIIGCASSATISACEARAATAERVPFGALADGTAIEAVTLTGANGVKARIMTLGATLQAFEAPDRDGRLADVTLGHDDAASYLSKPNYWGQTIGRYANRIAGGRFTLDGKPYQLTLNEEAASLHGGTTGFDKRVWRILSVEQGRTARVVLALTSPAATRAIPARCRPR